MIRPRSLPAAALVVALMVGAGCAHSDAPTTSSAASGGPSGAGGEGGTEPGAGPGGLGVGGFDVASSAASGPGGAGGADTGATSGGGIGGDGTGGLGGGGEGGGVLASHDPSGTELVSGGVSMSSPGYRAVLSVGQPAPVQNVMSSPGYRFEGGLLGVNGSLP